MGKRPVKYKKHPIKGCYKMNKKDKLRAEIIVEPEGLWLRKRLCIGSSMIYEEASRISGMNYQSLVDSTIRSRKTRDILRQAAHNLIVRSKKYAR